MYLSPFSTPSFPLPVTISAALSSRKSKKMKEVSFKFTQKQMQIFSISVIYCIFATDLDKQYKV